PSASKPPDLQPRPAEVEQQADRQAGGLEVIQALSDENLVMIPGGLDLDDQDILHDEIGREIADTNPVILHGDRSWLPHPKPGLPDRLRQGVLVDLLRKPGPEGIQDLERTADDRLGQPIQPLIPLIDRARFLIPGDYPPLPRGPSADLILSV